MLLALAEELGNLIELIGGAEHAHLILGPLEPLAAVEETAVRDKAADAICKVADAMPVGHIEVHLVPLIKRLAESADAYTGRSTACGLFGSAYAKVSDALKATLRTYVHLYSTLPYWHQALYDETRML